MRGATLESVFATVNAIYEAAFDQDSWGKAVSSVSDLFGGSRACVVRFGSGSCDAVCSVHDPQMRSIAALEAVMSDPLVDAYLAMPVGEVWQRSAIIDEAAFRKRELWHNWFRPRDMDGELVCKLRSSSTANWFLDVNRGARQDAFSEDDIDLMRKIAPHMQRAGQISRQIALSSSLDLPFGLLLADGGLRLLDMNEAAASLLGRPGGPLTLRGGVVGASDPVVDRALRRLVEDVCSLRDDVTAGSGGALRAASAASASGGYIVSVAPQGDSRAYGIAAERCAAIVVTEIGSRLGEGFDAHVRAVFGLTAAEARFAEDLANGLGVKEAAERNGLTIGTARTYLHRIFRKTDTRQQGQLVARLRTLHPLGSPPRTPGGQEAG